MVSILQQLAQEIEQARRGGLQIGQRDLPSGSPVGPYLHGPNSLFGVPGLSRDVISTRVMPTGIAGMLPTRATLQTDPLFAYVTGFQAPTGSQPDGVCDNPMVAGPIKNCFQTAQFGRYSKMTREMEVNRAGQQTNRGEFLDLRIINDPLLEGQGGITTPNVGGSSINFRREMATRMVEVGVAFQDELSRQVFQGNPANNSDGGGYKEFPGLDILIGTNKVDALTGTSCPSLASDIKNYQYGKVDEVGSEGGIVNVMTYMFRYLRHNAARMNMNPVQWVVAMRQELFYELTAVWPCSYLTRGCAFNGDNADNVRLNIDARDQIDFRDDMRNGNYLLIDGMRVPVVFDDAIVEETSGDNNQIDDGCFASDIYFIPLTVRGGLAVTYWEHIDYVNGAMLAIEDARLAASYFWTDGGRYLWHAKPPNNWCIQLLAKIEPRIILLTPHLAGRVLNVQFCPLQHTRSPFHDDPYFVDGGVSTARPGPSHYSDWQLP